MVDFAIHEFVAVQRELLASELKSEEEEEQAIASSTKRKDDDSSTSRVLRNLDVQYVSVGLYGRSVVTLGLEFESLLPAHRFTTGDEVQILSKSSPKDSSGGVICAVTDVSISVALFGKNQKQDEQEESIVGQPPLTLVPKSSVDVHNKLVQALSELERHTSSHPIAGKVVCAAFSNDVSWSSLSPSIDPFNIMLDESQLEAISFSLTEDRAIALIHGPPGTGKTSTIAELILQAVHKFKYKVLVTAPSNVAVDNVLERIVQSQSPKQKKNNKRIRAVRLGHPARIKESILSYSLEALVQASDGTEIVADVRRELSSFLQVLTSPRSRGSDKRVAYREIKSLRKEVKAREQKVVDQLIKDAQVVLATTVGAANKILDEIEFDLVVIDEAAQALEASCWIPILRGKKLVLAGDHCQLPPTIKCNDPTVQNGLSKTLFERLMDIESQNKHTYQISRMLRVQYRMHEDIAKWASTAMYHGKLQTHDSVRHRKLSDLHNVTGDFPTLLLIDTSGCNMNETVNAAGSRFNEGESQLVFRHVKSLIQQGVKAQDIAVISPYNGQVEVLRLLLLPEFPTLEIRSVDGFQGGEREAVVLSLVRSNNKGDIGFLKDDRRLNVAVTRARRHCAVVCDLNTVQQNPFIGSLTDWMEEYGDYCSAMEFQFTDLNRDLEDAEREVLKLTARQIVAKSDRVVGRNDVHPRHDKEKDALRAKTLLEKCSLFTKNGIPGEELIFGSDLSRNDRRIVHEFATDAGLDHRSEGVDGVDRHIILRIPIKHEPEASYDIVDEALDKSCVEDESSDGDADFESEGKEPRNSVSFTALVDEESDEGEKEGEGVTPDMIPDVHQSSTNSLLENLALERRQREQLRASMESQEQKPSVGCKTKKKKGKKLGGAKLRPEKVETMDNLDDMAYLDAQIDKVQNSHGRKVDGKGNYKTIINGYLLAKPKELTRKKDARATAELNSKLKKAQESRRPQPKKK